MPIENRSKVEMTYIGDRKFSLESISMEHQIINSYRMLSMDILFFYDV